MFCSNERLLCCRPQRYPLPRSVAAGVLQPQRDPRPGEIGHAGQSVPVCSASRLCPRTLAPNNTAPESKPRPMGAKQTPGRRVEYSDAALRRGMRWPRKHVDSNNGSRNGGSLTSSLSSHAPESELPFMVHLRLKLWESRGGGITLGFRLIGDGRGLAIYHIP